MILGDSELCNQGGTAQKNGKVFLSAQHGGHWGIRQTA